MFGEDEEIRQLKKALQAAGCDMAVVKKWQRQLEWTRKQRPSVYAAYMEARSALVHADTYLKQVQQLLTGKEAWTKERFRELSGIRKELKKLENVFDHEFLVSRDDKEFHLTYQSILKQMDKFDGTDDMRIFLLSEVENILALIREDLEKERPDAAVLAFFYLGHTDAELTALPPVGRLVHISSVYEKEFLQPILEEVAKCDEVSQDQVTAIIERMVRA